MINLTKIVAAILVVLALSLGAYAWMLSRTPPTKPAAASSNAEPSREKLYPVVVTTRAVPAGQVLAADSLRVAQLPINPADAFSDASLAAGRVAIVDMGEGTPLLKSQLVSGLATRLGDGERAVAVKADEAMAVGGRIEPGDFVDVFVNLKIDGREIDRSQSRLLLSRIRVLAFGSASVDGGPSRTDAKATNGQNRADVARTTVLAVPVDQVNALNLGDAGGRLLLALRNPKDQAVPDASLFAEAPMALTPLVSASRPRGSALLPVEKAQGGLAVADFVTGGKPLRTTVMQQSNTSGRAAVARTSAPSGLEVEVIKGDKRETIRY